MRTARDIPGSVGQPTIVSVWVTGAVDSAILLYSGALALLLLTGGVDAPWLRIEHAAKPLFILLLLVSLRGTLRSHSWLTRYVERVRNAARPSIASVRAGISPAIRDASFAVAATLPAILAVGFFVNVLFPPARVRPFAMPFGDAKLAETFAAWDSGWYFDIARRGYYFVPDAQSSVPFFPLYPLAMRTLAWPFGASDRTLWLCGIVISCASFFAALAVLHRLTERMCGGHEVAGRTVLYVAVFPFSFFLTRVYPSALFFLLTVLAIDAAHRSRWWQAGVWGALATLTRPHGVLIALPLGLMALQRGTARQVAWRLAALAPIPAALAAFSAYIFHLTGDPLAWLHGESAWGYSLWHAPWRQLVGLFGEVEEHGVYGYLVSSELALPRFVHGSIALFVLMMLPAVFRRLGLALGAYVLVNLLIPLSSNALEGIGRYAAVWFPLFMTMGTWQSVRLRETILITWSLLLALFTGLFVTWHPIY